MEGVLLSDETPLDTDFSEITRINLFDVNNEKLSKASDIIQTTASTYFGNSFYVIKKQDYNPEDSWTEVSGNKKTRYIRTSKGANCISAIITSAWSDEYGYIMAQHGVYIPVIDLDTNNIVFTEEQYKSIREKMAGLSFFDVPNVLLDKSIKNLEVGKKAAKLREEEYQADLSIQEKESTITELVKKRFAEKGIKVATEMIGELSEDTVEFIATGSTQRGTNIPKESDFDFMLKCANTEQGKKLIDLLKSFITGNAQYGTNELNIRYEDAKMDGLSEPVDIDISSVSKSLTNEYSCDLSIRDRLESIGTEYGEEYKRIVLDNIIVAKKMLKERGMYKKKESTGCTKNGGFGGIGIENWILQNGGSFVLAMESFLDNCRDENEANLGLSEFMQKYPIYDFGKDHIRGKHVHHVEGLTEEGFAKMKQEFVAILQELGVEYKYCENRKIEGIPSEKKAEEQKKESFTASIIDYTEKADGYIITNYAEMVRMMATLRAHETSNELTR